MCWVWALCGWHEGARGGRPSPVCGASGVGRSPTPHRPSFGACGRGPLPTNCGCGECGRGDPSPTPLCALLRAGFARCGGGRRPPGAGAPCLGVGRPGLGALPTRTARPLGRAPGAHYPLAVGVGGVGVGTHHQPHSARSCQLALCALGAARGRPGGAPLACMRSVPGRALSHPRPLVLWGVRPGPTTHWLWVRGVWAWEPVTHPSARALASWLCALLGRHQGARGGGASCLCVGRPGSSALPPPDRSSMGVRPGTTTHWLWVRGGWVWKPVSSPTARALASWLWALWERHEGARGGRLLPVCGASGVGRSLSPDRLSFGACCRGPLPTGPGCGGCGRGVPSPAAQRALWRAGFARCGGGKRAPRGAPLAWARGVQGRALPYS